MKFNVTQNTNITTHTYPPIKGVKCCCYCDGFIPIRMFMEKGATGNQYQQLHWVPTTSLEIMHQSLKPLVERGRNFKMGVYVIPGTVSERGQGKATDIIQYPCFVVDIDSGDITGVTFGTTASATISGSFTSVSSSIATRFDSRETDMTLATASIAAITASVSRIDSEIDTNTTNITLATASIAAITSSISELKTSVRCFNYKYR